jgi:tRNA pseudouridine13 synthase
MRWATGEAGAHEQAVLSAAAITPEQLQRVRLDGSRRLARLRPLEVEVTSEPGALALAFFLPKGAYATVLLRELRKEEGEAGNDGGEDEA